MSNRTGDWLDICLAFARRAGTQPGLLCAAASRGGLLCPGCAGELPTLPVARCPRCAVPSHGGAVCAACLRHPPAYARTLAALPYADPVDSLVQALKFRGETALARYFAERMAACLDNVPRPDLLCPMPLHPSRLRERGYNQAALLARRLSALTGIAVAASLCRRTRDTPAQSSLPLADRRRNVRRAFACTPVPAGIHVALIDDVMTTGASLDALASTLLDAGAAEVSAWVLARTLPR